MLLHRELRFGSVSTIQRLYSILYSATQFHQHSSLQDTIFPFLIIFSVQSAYATLLRCFCLRNGNEHHHFHLRHSACASLSVQSQSKEVFFTLCYSLDKIICNFCFTEPFYISVFYIFVRVFNHMLRCSGVLLPFYYVYLKRNIVGYGF